MAQLLSFSQVREFPLFAWHPQGYLLIGGELFRAVRMEPSASVGYQGVLAVRRSSLREGDHTLDFGWQHADGCGCDLCRAEVDASHPGVPFESAGVRA